MEEVKKAWEERLRNIENRIEYLHEQIDKKLAESKENSVKDELLELDLLLEIQETNISLVSAVEELKDAIWYLK